MKSLYKLTAVCLLTVFSIFAYAAETQKQTIVDIASSNADFSTLVTALKAADLVTVLQGNGPYTVFAPTNEAFNQLPAGTLDDLLKPENKEKLKNILLYHVVSGKVMSKDVKPGHLKAADGKKIVVTVKDGVVYLNDSAKVTTADINASNGVIHVIDQVILPPAK